MISDKLKATLSTLPTLSGVYRMLGEQGEVLYVGKAKSLKSRVSSYFYQHISHPKTQALVAKIRDIELTVTTSETEALLLEQNLIKTLKPPFNILLRDDKSYPYIALSDDKLYPSLSWQRGKHHHKTAKVFGPYPNSQAVHDSLLLLQKLFQVRQCDDSTFKNRERPCLQYQIKRCRAPCVGLISPEDYAQDVASTVRFLTGKNNELQHSIIEKMEQASAELAFEAAAIYRDQLSALRQIQTQQSVYCEQGEADVFAVAEQSGLLCVQVLFVRGGRVLGSKSYFPETTESEYPEILREFLTSFYWQQPRDLPLDIIVSHPLSHDDTQCLLTALEQSYGKKIILKSRVKEDRAAWLSLAQLNASEALKARLANKMQVMARLAALQHVLNLDAPPQRIECFDISHTQGEATVASCVVYDSQGAKKRDYRHFLIKDIVGGDDYAAMEQALTRRFSKLSADSPLPDVLLIDGGKGQLTQAKNVLSRLNIRSILLVGVAKGEGRKAGLETLHFEDGHTLQLASDAIALHVIQFIRDEAHRFAITKHRAKRDKTRRTSPLEAIPRLGVKRRRELLNHFGGLQGVLTASIKELAAVPHIGLALAETIYAILH
jgi:excinuclease ABC subunit C